MRIRVAAGLFLVRAGRFIRSLSVMIMRPDDIVEFNRRVYSRAGSVDDWAGDDLVDAGLSPEESALLERVPRRGGEMLLLGVGGGREAVPLAKMGFRITGVDFVPELAERAVANLRKRGSAMQVLVQDISRLDVRESFYDLAWLAAGTYSSIPTRRRRIDMLRRIRRALKPGGHFLCQFLFDGESEFGPRWEFVRKMFSLLTLGNLSYERGDRLAAGVEFAHYFRTADEIRSEFLSAGFEIVDLEVPRTGVRGGAVLRTPN